MEKSLDFYLKYQLFYDPTLVTSNTTSTKSLRFKPGGHSRVLARSIRLPREDFIVLKELDLDDDRVLNMVLTNIKEGNNKGLFLTNTGYRGKYPKKWFNFLYPHELDPILIGILDLADILMGWMSLIKSAKYSHRVIFGLYLSEEFKDARLEYAILLHV